jgi:hypothetical protein
MPTPAEIYGGSIGSGMFSGDLLIDYYLDEIRGTRRISKPVTRRLRSELLRIEEGIRKFEYALWKNDIRNNVLLYKYPTLTHHLTSDLVKVTMAARVRNDLIEVRFEYTDGYIPQRFLLIGDNFIQPALVLEDAEKVSVDDIMKMLEAIFVKLEHNQSFDSFAEITPPSDAIVYTLRKKLLEKTSQTITTT